VAAWPSTSLSAEQPLYFGVIPKQVDRLPKYPKPAIAAWPLLGDSLLNRILGDRVWEPRNINHLSSASITCETAQAIVRPGLHWLCCFSAEPAKGVPPPLGVGGAPMCPDQVQPGCRRRHMLVTRAVPEGAT
jgi:hypothetical protein